MNHSYILQKISKIDILKPMKFPEIWQKFLKTYTAKVFACLIFTDIPFFIIFCIFGIQDLFYNNSLKDDVTCFTTFEIGNTIYKIIILLVSYFIEKIFLKPDYTLIKSTPKGLKLEKLSILIQLIGLICLIIFILFVIIFV